MKNSDKKHNNLIRNLSLVLGCSVLSLWFYLQFTSADGWSFWFDESFSSFMTRYDPLRIIFYSATDVHPPLYYLLLKLWSAIFGSNDLALRSMSIVAGAIAALINAKLIFKMTKSYGLSAATLVFVLFNAYVFRYSQEARMYILAAAFIGASNYFFYVVRTTQDKNLAERSMRGYVLFTTLAFYAHYFSLAAVIAHNLYVFYTTNNFRVSDNGLSRDIKTKLAVYRKDVSWKRMQKLVALFCLPWAPILISQSFRVGSGFWIEDISVDVFFATIFKIFFYNEPASYSPAEMGVAWLALASVLGFVVITTLKSTKQQRANSILLFGPFVALLAVMAVVSATPGVSSIFYHRYLALATGIMFTGLAYCLYLSFLNVNKILTVLYAASLTIICCVGVYNVWYDSVERHSFVSKEGLRLMKLELAEGDVIVSKDYWRVFDIVQYVDDSTTVVTTTRDKITSGEGLLNGMSDKYVVQEYSDISYDSGVVWYVSGSDGSNQEFLPDEFEVDKVIFDKNNFKISRLVAR